MIKCDWIDFQVDNELITQDRFEEMINDTFQAMTVDGNNFPQIIWTANFVIVVTIRFKIVEEVEYKQIPRNPACE